MPKPKANTLVWDWPVRIGHWLMVLLVAACWWTAENQAILYHSYCAYALLAVVVFRLYWGFNGSSTARFSQFLCKPPQALHYLKTLSQRDQTITAGHNPLGAYSVVALLCLLLAQIGLGLFAIDVDGFDGGPYADYVSFDTARQIAHWHAISFNVLLGFVALHIAAVLYYLLWRRQNLIARMIHGNNPEVVEPPIKTATTMQLLAGFVLTGLIIYGVIFY